MKPAYLSHIADAERQIRTTGERVTQPRVAVLALLMAAGHAATHQDVTAAIASHHPMDRVTVYRVLDWLVEVGIAHRIAGDDRVWRFMLNPGDPGNPHQQHAHFTCTKCAQTFCLNDLPTRFNFKLPDGFRPTEVDLKFRGTCLHCT
jgi:Fur family ferric uptake transcriptional regulator